MNSQATWKVIAADMPISLVRVHDPDRNWGHEGIAQGDGPPRGRELEIADILSFIKRAGIRNTLWITADVHFTAAHYFDPDKAVFQDFDPFWEFVSGPINAGTGIPGRGDNTFGMQVAYVKGSTRELGGGLSPAAGLQFFGHVAIDGATEVMTVTLKDVADTALWSRKLEPRLRGSVIRRQQSELPHRLAHRHRAGHRHIERAQALPHRDQEPRVGRLMHRIGHPR